MSSAWPALPELRVEGLLARTRQGAIYRAMREGHPVAVRVLESADDALRARFRREAAELARLNHPAIIRVHSVEEHGELLYAITERVDGDSLAALAARGPVREATLTSIARSLAGALDSAHQRGHVRGELSLSSITVHPGGQVKLVDLGAEPQEADAGAAAGFRAPERAGTGRGAVDARSDLFALGAILRHCAGTPALLGDGLRRVLTRLTEEDPERRYQSGAELAAELDALSLQGGGGRLLPVHPGRLPAHRRPPPPRLFGRNWELAELRAIWTEARGGNGKAVLVEGDPGSGKSRLVEEVAEEARASGALVLAGKCSLAASAPFAALRLALEEHLREVGESSELTRRVRAAAGPLAPVLRRFSPALALLLEDAGGAVEVGEQQFFDSLADFFVAFAQAHGPTLLFIDDVQWLDEASREVLARVAARALKTGRLLVAMTARSDGESEPAVARHCARFERLARMKLGPLDDLSLGELVRDQLGGREVDWTFVKQVAAYSAGSPFAAGEYVRAMLDAGRLLPSWDRWRVAPPAPGAAELPANVLQLVFRRLATLHPQMADVLGAAAVQGSPFSSELLLEQTGLAAAQVDERLGEAMREHLVERRSRSSYAFVHDQVQEALLSQLTEPARRALHQQLAERLERRGGAGDDAVFALAHHLGHGEPERDPLRVQKVNLEAAARALGTHAHEKALEFLKTARAAAALAGTESAPELLELEGEAQARTGRLVEAVERFEAALERTEDRWKRVTLRTRIAKARCSNFESAKAWPQVVAALEEAGQRFPRNGVLRVLALLWAWLAGILAWRRRASQGSAKGEPRARLNVLLELYDVGALVAYFQVNPLRYMEFAVRCLRPACLVSPSRESSRALSTYGAVLATLQLRGTAERFLSLGGRMAEQLEDPLARARNLFYDALAQGFLGEAVEEQRRGERMEPMTRWLDTGDYISHYGAVLFSQLMRGYHLEAFACIEKIRAAAQQTMVVAGGASEGHATLSFQLSVLPALGREEEAGALLARLTGLGAQSTYARGIVEGNRLGFFLETGELGEPFDDAVAAFEALKIPAPVVPLHLKHFFVFRAYGELERAQRPGGATAQQRRRLARAARTLRSVANVPLLRCHALVVRAALARLAGRTRQAAALLGEAEAVARATDSPYGAYAAALERVRLLEAAGDGARVRAELTRARELSVAQGWLARTRALEARLAAP